MSRAGGDHGARPALVVPGVPQCPALVAGDDAETLASSVVGVLGRCGLTRCDDGGAAEWQHFPVGSRQPSPSKCQCARARASSLTARCKAGLSRVGTMGQPAFLGRSADHVAGQQLSLPQVLVFVELRLQHRVPPTSYVPGQRSNFRVFNPAARVSEVNQCRIAGASCHGHLESTYTVGTEHLAATYLIGSTTSARPCARV